MGRCGASWAGRRGGRRATAKAGRYWSIS